MPHLCVAGMLGSGMARQHRDIESPRQEALDDQAAETFCSTDDDGMAAGHRGLDHRGLDHRGLIIVDPVNADHLESGGAPLKVVLITCRRDGVAVGRREIRKHRRLGPKRPAGDFVYHQEVRPDDQRVKKRLRHPVVESIRLAARSTLRRQQHDADDLAGVIEDDDIDRSLDNMEGFALAGMLVRPDIGTRSIAMIISCSASSPWDER